MPLWPCECGFGFPFAFGAFVLYASVIKIEILIRFINNFSIENSIASEKGRTRDNDKSHSTAPRFSTGFPRIPENKKISFSPNNFTEKRALIFFLSSWYYNLKIWLI